MECSDGRVMSAGGNRLLIEMRTQRRIRLVQGPFLSRYIQVLECLAVLPNVHQCTVDIAYDSSGQCNPDYWLRLLFPESTKQTRIGMLPDS